MTLNLSLIKKIWIADHCCSIFKLHVILPHHQSHHEFKTCISNKNLDSLVCGNILRLCGCSFYNLSHDFKTGYFI